MSATFDDQMSDVSNGVAVEFEDSESFDPDGQATLRSQETQPQDISDSDAEIEELGSDTPKLTRGSRHRLPTEAREERMRAFSENADPNLATRRKVTEIVKAIAGCEWYTLTIHTKWLNTTRRAKRRALMASMSPNGFPFALEKELRSLLRNGRRPPDNEVIALSNDYGVGIKYIEMWLHGMSVALAKEKEHVMEDGLLSNSASPSPGPIAIVRRTITINKNCRNHPNTPKSLKTAAIPSIQPPSPSQSATSAENSPGHRDGPEGEGVDTAFVPVDFSSQPEPQLQATSSNRTGNAESRCQLPSRRFGNSAREFARSMEGAELLHTVTNLRHSHLREPMASSSVSSLRVLGPERAEGLVRSREEYLTQMSELDANLSHIADAFDASNF